TQLQDPALKRAIAQDCTQLIDRQVSAKGGLSGIALKGAYRVVKGIGANYVQGAVERLLPETGQALEPLWSEGVQKGDPVAHLSAERDRAADLILQTTDRRIARAGNAVLSGVYNKLRKSVKPDVVAAVPELAQTLKKHLN
ncbi:MAG: hypothetical protein AAFS04_17605, partial [Cyanobacteria bacterium J06631_9]